MTGHRSDNYGDVPKEPCRRAILDTQNFWYLADWNGFYWADVTTGERLDVVEWYDDEED